MGIVGALSCLFLLGCSFPCPGTTLRNKWVPSHDGTTGLRWLVRADLRLDLDAGKIADGYGQTWFLPPCGTNCPSTWQPRCISSDAPGTASCLAKATWNYEDNSSNSKKFNCAIFFSFPFTSSLRAAAPVFPQLTRRIRPHFPDDEPLESPEPSHLLPLQLHVRSFSHGHIPQPDWLPPCDATLNRPGCHLSLEGVLLDFHCLSPLAFVGGGHTITYYGVPSHRRRISASLNGQLRDLPLAQPKQP
ncbi:hypothetical protein VTI74DRAFT_11051 [Chaetomium olivicolor]